MVAVSEMRSLEAGKFVLPTMDYAEDGGRKEGEITTTTTRGRTKDVPNSVIDTEGAEGHYPG